METKVVGALRDHCTYNQVAVAPGVDHQRKGQKYFAQITDLVATPGGGAGGQKSVLRTLGSLGLQRIMAIRALESLVPMPPVIEKLFQTPASFDF